MRSDVGVVGAVRDEGESGECIDADTRTEDETLASLTTLAWLIGSAIPVAIVMESILRDWLLPKSFDALCVVIHPYVMRAVYILSIALVLCSLLAWVVGKMLRGSTQDSHKGIITSFVLASSIVQLPLLGTSVCFLLGADWQPVMCALVFGSLMIARLYIESRRAYLKTKTLE